MSTVYVAGKLIESLMSTAPMPKSVAETMADHSRARTDANLRAAIEAARDAVKAAERVLAYNDNTSHRITGVLHALSAGNSQAMTAMQSAISANEDERIARLMGAGEALAGLLIESQENIGGDWRERRDALLAQVKAGKA